MDLMNPGTLATFQELMATDELREFLDRVCQEMQRAHAQLLQLHAGEDWAGMQKLAHRLKGSLGSVGCDALYAALHQLDADLMQTPAQRPSADDMSRLSALMASTSQHLQGL